MTYRCVAVPLLRVEASRRVLRVEPVSLVGRVLREQKVRSAVLLLLLLLGGWGMVLGASTAVVVLGEVGLGEALSENKQEKY